MQKPTDTETQNLGTRNEQTQAQNQHKGMGLRIGLKNTQNQHRSYEAGFIMISFSLLTLTLAAVAILGLSILHYWKLNNSSKTQCISQVFKAQTLITEKINYLISLNPKAKKLHSQHRFWKMKLVAAIAARNLVAANQARTKIHYYQTQINSLDKLQRGIIQSTNLIFQSWGANTHQGGTRKLHINRSSLGLAPQYSLQNSATQKHAIWKYGSTQPNALLAQFFRVDPSKNWKWHCGASIEQRSNEWKPRLIEAKYYWNSHSLSS